MTDLAGFQPRARPGDVTLQGRCGSIEKLNASRHGADLWAAFKDHPELWDYMPSGPFENANTFNEWLKDRAALDDPYFYAILDKNGRALGMAALMRITPDMGVIEVGNIAYSPALQRAPLATEAQYLLAAYAFDTLHYRRYEWKCNALNAASRRAAERYGFTFEGIFRQHMVVKGKNRDTAWFAITDGEWPARKAAFERWLSPDNFDAQGRQKMRLNPQASQGGCKETKWRGA
jgi:RimJ/RimL family protein N-acetyltransferase